MNKNNNGIKVRDLVCGMMVDLGETAIFSEYEREKYHFCSNFCKESFDKNPKHYTSKKK